MEKLTHPTYPKYQQRNLLFSHSSIWNGNVNKHNIMPSVQSKYSILSVLSSAIIKIHIEVWDACHLSCLFKVVSGATWPILSNTHLTHAFYWMSCHRMPWKWSKERRKLHTMVSLIFIFNMFLKYFVPLTICNAPARI